MQNDPKKIVVTIMQCKRVVLPYLFIKHCLPVMRKSFNGEIKIYLIQHVGGLPHTKYMDTSRQGDEGLKLVAEWTRDGKYDGAEIIQHSECDANFPTLPSLKKSVEISTKEHADLHVWLEDDAIIYEPNCGDWFSLMKDKEIGVFRSNEFVHTAYFVSDYNYDKRLLDEIDSLEFKLMPLFIDEGLPTQRVNPDSKTAEVVLDKIRKTEKAFLNNKSAGRVHVNKSLNLFEILNLACPDSLEMLKIDFPELRV